MIIGTAGHIDHGKTRLVRALTGIDTARLKEEKERGISIDLGYAYVPLANGDILGYVDVPGHERLVRTMVAGASGIDFALLVIAADDGIMPQTREHLAILELLNISGGAVALTKIDRVDAARVRAVSESVASFIAHSALDGSPIFPVNATAAEDPGIGELRRHLERVASAWPARASGSLFRLAVDRVFTLPGHGTVVAGTVHSGRVRIGDTLAVMPQGTEVRVRSIHAQHRDVDVGHTGERCALNLVGIERSKLSRGDWIADPRALAATDRIDVRLRRLADRGSPLETGSTVHVHLGTADRVASVYLLEGEELAAGACARAQLVFEKAVCAAAGDVFVVRDAAALLTLGGGRVLDPNAPARRRRNPPRIAYLDGIEAWLRGEGLTQLLRSRPQGMSLANLVRICGQDAEQLPIPPGSLTIDGAREHWLLLEPTWLELLDRARTTLRAFHAEHVREPGVERGRWRRMTAPEIDEAVWRAAVEELLQSGEVVRTGPWLHLPGHRVALTEAEQARATPLLASIRAGGFDPPWVRELAAQSRLPEAEVRALLEKCSMFGSVYSVVPDLFYHPDRIRELVRVFEELAQQHRAIEASRYRDAVKLGRKRAIQILEFFDRVGYTRRTIKGRIPRSDSSWHEPTAFR